MNCPACNRPIEPNTAYVCRQCWPKVPAKDRRMLGAMRINKQNTDSKVAKIVRDLKALYARLAATTPDMRPSNKLKP